MKKNVSFLILVLLVITLVGCNTSDNEIAALQEELEAAESQIEYLEQQERLRRENDRVMYLRDLNNFIESGVLDLGLQYDTSRRSYQVINPDDIARNEYGYILNRAAALMNNKTGEWVSINASPGETINLFFEQNSDAKQEIIYYTCFTNSTNCYLTITSTGILIGN